MQAAATIDSDPQVIDSTADVDGEFDESIGFEDARPTTRWAPTPGQIEEFAAIIRQEWSESETLTRAK